MPSPAPSHSTGSRAKQRSKNKQAINPVFRREDLLLRVVALVCLWCCCLYSFLFSLSWPQRTPAKSTSERATRQHGAPKALRVFYFRGRKSGLRHKDVTVLVEVGTAASQVDLQEEDRIRWRRASPQTHEQQQSDKSPPSCRSFFCPILSRSIARNFSAKEENK